MLLAMGIGVQVRDGRRNDWGFYESNKKLVDIQPKLTQEEKEAEERRQEKEREIRAREDAKRRKANAIRAKREEEERKAKERKDAAQGCGCLLAIIALVIFGIWWWIEGFSMSAITDLWKSANKDGSLGTAVMVLGGLAATFIGWKLLKKNDSGESTSPKKRWKFITLGILFGFLGAHLAYAKRWVLFLLLWAGLICGNVMNEKKTTDGAPDAPPAVQEQNQEELKPEGGSQESEKKSSNPISNAGFAVWGLLWIGGTLFIKKDGNGCRM
jgi:F0F1-type ATP synthase assembly protein I